MSVQDNQQRLLTAIDQIVQDRVNKISHPKNMIGIVEQRPTGYKCLVRIHGQLIECKLPEHLHSWIQQDDIVVVQDVYGNGSLMMVESKTGEIQENPSVVLYDEEINRNVSGADMVVDEEGNDLGYASVIFE